MSDETSPLVRKSSLAEEFMQHVEAGTSKIRAISVISIVVAVLLAVSYVYQIFLPLAAGTRTVPVDLADPALIALEVVLLAVVLVWLLIALREYLFTVRLTKQVREIRRLEDEFAKKLGLDQVEEAQSS